MTFSSLRLTLAAALVTACFSTPTLAEQAASIPGVDGAPLPTDSETLFAYLQSGAYKEWNVKESQTHPSRGPHTKFRAPVRVFFSDNLAISMAANAKTHPVGSSLVKEMYEKDGTTLIGWAVMVKTKDEGKRGDDWYWYEAVSPTDSTKLAVTPGNGVKLCTSCHARGKDFVVTRFPLK